MINATSSGTDPVSDSGGGAVTGGVGDKDSHDNLLLVVDPQFPLPATDAPAGVNNLIRGPCRASIRRQGKRVPRGLGNAAVDVGLGALHAFGPKENRLVGSPTWPVRQTLTARPRSSAWRVSARRWIGTWDFAPFRSSAKAPVGVHDLAKSDPHRTGKCLTKRLPPDLIYGCALSPGARDTGAAPITTRRKCSVVASYMETKRAHAAAELALVALATGRRYPRSSRSWANARDPIDGAEPIMQSGWPTP